MSASSPKRRHLLGSALAALAGATPFIVLESVEERATVFAIDRVFLVVVLSVFAISFVASLAVCHLIERSGIRRNRFSLLIAALCGLLCGFVACFLLDLPNIDLRQWKAYTSASVSGMLCTTVLLRFIERDYSRKG